MKQDFLCDMLCHSWGTSPKQKKRESEYNAEYYQKHKEKWQDNRPHFRDKYVTNNGTGVNKGDSIYEGTKADLVREELAQKQYELSEWQRAANNTVYLYEKEINNVIDDIKATKTSALINLKHGKLLSAATDFVSAKLMERSVKKAKKYYKDLKKPLRQARVSNQHAIDEIARINKNRRPKNLVSETPAFIPLK